MRLQLIRNATMILDYAGQRILADPDFAPKETRRSFTGKARNPMVDLPIPPEQIMAGIGLVLVTHLHADHFDEKAQAALPKTLPLLCQPGDEGKIAEKGFQDVRPVDGEVSWNGVRVTRVGGHHGLGEVEADMGKVSGFVLRAEGEPTIYWAGDTVMCDEVRAGIAEHRPDVVITHSSGAVWPVSSGAKVLIVMDAAQTVEASRLAAGGKVVAVHLESLDHGTVSRADVRAAAQAAGIAPERLLIPVDGETLSIE